MIGLDTNVLVRIVTRDDPEQLPAAMAVMEAARLHVTKTVLQELEWVLRYSYRLGREEISRALVGLLGLRRLEVEDREAVVRAYQGYQVGMDWADALHLASRPAGGSLSRFATFDRKLAKTAEGVEAMPEVELLGA